MKLVRYYSHLNGWEHLKVHKAALWRQIEDVIEAVDAEGCRVKQSNEKRKVGQMLYDPAQMNRAFKHELEGRGWHESRTSYYVTADHRLIRKTIGLTREEQKRAIESAGEEAIQSYNQTDFVNDRVEIEVQFGKYFAVAYDLFVKHMAFFVEDVIDVGVEILPTKALQRHMSSGVPYYEGELYNLLRQGRSTPAVPLIIGVEP